LGLRDAEYLIDFIPIPLSTFGSAWHPLHTVIPNVQASFACIRLLMMHSSSTRISVVPAFPMPHLYRR
jgi:hypothetical protein